MVEVDRPGYAAGLLLRPLTLAWIALTALSGCYLQHAAGGAPCEDTRDCAESPVTCAQAICVASTCQLIPVPDACDADETCDFVRGCVGDGDDAGLDAGLDGATDGGRDTGFAGDVMSTDDAPMLDVPMSREAGMDAPPLDVGRLDAGRLDAGRVDGGALDAPRVDAPRTDAPVDAPRPDAPRPDAPPPDAPRDTGVDGGPPRTSSARVCRTDSVITIGDRPVLSSETTTLELWVRVRGPGTIARKGEEGGRRMFDLTVQGTGDATTLRATWSSGPTSQFVEVPFGSRVGVYTHIALIHAPSDASGRPYMELWLDGMAVASANLPGPVFEAFNNVPLLFCTFDGDLDEIRLWGAVLSGALIASRRFGTVPTSSAGLRAYWQLEGSGQIIFDRTLIGSDGVAGDFSTPDPRDPLTTPDGAF